MGELAFFDETPELDEEQWSSITAVYGSARTGLSSVEKGMRDIVIYGDLVKRVQSVSISVRVVDYTFMAHPKGLRFAALGALVPTSKSC